jgi:diguanylate cyclase (GGDEF)-like protein
MTSELHPGEYANLLTSAKHSPLLASKRMVMIVNRVRFIALLCAILVPLWCVVDYAAFPYELWTQLAVIRVLTGGALMGLVVFYKPRANINLRHAHQAVYLLFLIPCLFYLAAYYLLASFTLADSASNTITIASSYALLPFALVAGLSIFPLSVRENLMLVGMILVVQLVASLAFPNNQSWMCMVGAFWLLILLASISTLAGVSQLAFIVALVRQAVRDPLTACFTRRSGEELLNLQFSISCRSKTPLALAFVDLDHFKLVNDHFGHEAGDVMLQQAATSIMQVLRSGDILARWGGEEFLIIMPDTDIQQAEVALARLRHAGLGKRPDGKNITASIGISERLQDNATDQHVLIERSDHRMYLAKERGRNQIVKEG